jgi:TATA-binding protein-associated factor Taf7
MRNKIDDFASDKLAIKQSDVEEVEVEESEDKEEEKEEAGDDEDDKEDDNRKHFCFLQDPFSSLLPQSTVDVLDAGTYNNEHNIIE